MTPREIEDALGLAPMTLTIGEGSDGEMVFTPKLSRVQAEKVRRMLVREQRQPATALEEIEASGFLTSVGVRLGCGAEDQAQWLKLSTHLDMMQDAISKVSGEPWEQVRTKFESQPIKVQTYDGETWTTTIGEWRSAFLEMSTAYLSAWSAEH